MLITTNDSFCPLGSNRFRIITKFDENKASTSAVNLIHFQNGLRCSARASKRIEDNGIFLSNHTKDSLNRANGLWIWEICLAESEKFCKHFRPALAVNILECPNGCRLYISTFVKILPFEQTPLLLFSHVARVKVRLLRFCSILSPSPCSIRTFILHGFNPDESTRSLVFIFSNTQLSRSLVVEKGVEQVLSICTLVMRSSLSQVFFAVESSVCILFGVPFCDVFFRRETAEDKV